MGGFGYVYVKWSVFGSLPYDDTCSISHFNVILSSVYNSTTVVVTSGISYNFTGLSNGTLFNVTVVGINVKGNNFTNPAFASVRTNVTEGMLCTVYKYIFVCMYIYAYTHTYITR